MRALAVIVLATLPLMGAFAQELPGRAIVLKTGDHGTESAPVALKYDGAAPSTNIHAVDRASGTRYPATVANGSFVFVAAELKPNTTYTLDVEVAKEFTLNSARIEPREIGNALEVIVHDKLLTVYYHEDDAKKPYLWPLNSEGGVSVTRSWPMGDKDQTTDHPHHKSFWTAYGNVNGADCWTEGENTGKQKSGDVDWGAGDAFAWIRAKNVWEDNGGKPVISEEREYRFYSAVPESVRLIDVRVTFTADHGDVHFKDTKEGGIVSLRIADELREKGGTGTITQSTGAVGSAQCWGKPAAWCDYSGTIAGAGKRGVAVFDHPKNLRHPTHWHVRDYGLMGANCFGYNDFTSGKENGDYDMKAGESLTFNYRLYVHSGDVKEAEVAEQYAGFANPPKAEWVTK